MSCNAFDILILNGRPAAGKSEIIDFLKKVPVGERIAKYHVGHFIEIDDFPVLWERFEDDDLYEELGMERTFSTKEYYFKDKRLWHFLIKKFNLAYNKIMRDDPYFHEHTTLLIEFSRGSEHGGFKEAYDYLSSEILSRAATLYIKVPFEESLRRNRRRFNPDKPDSILEHGLPDEKLIKLYKESDWDEFAADGTYLHVRDHKVPFVEFINEPEKTDDPAKIEPHLKEIMDRLWKNYSELRK